MIEVALGVALFTAVVMTLVAGVLLARAWIQPGGEARVIVNDERTFTARVGETLLDALGTASIRIPSACSGKGVCGQCRVRVTSGGGPPLPTETSLLARREISHGVRLACQLTVRGDLSVAVPEDVLGVKHWLCRVRSTRWLSTLLKEIVLELPEGESIRAPAGRYVLVTAPPYRIDYREIPVEGPTREQWERLDLFRHRTGADQPTTRAYSVASHPGEKGIAMLIVRLATPPPATPDVPPGVVSSWLFSRRTGDEVEVAGPYGHFFVEAEDSELIFVGGGAGMAAMRPHILDQLLRLETPRRISFWYGARHRSELFYVEEFDRLQAEHPNFSWTVALSEPLPEDAWDGETGFIHQVLQRRYLAEHPAPETCAYYLCGPPMMVRAVRAMLDELGVEPERIRADDFGNPA